MTERTDELANEVAAKVVADELKQAVEEEAEAEAATAPTFEVILASSSPRRPRASGCGRREVHRAHAGDPGGRVAGARFGRRPRRGRKKLAERKAGAVIQEVLAENYIGMLIVIGADTMVVLDGKIFGKPRSASDGKHMLRQLSGRTHEVITAVSVWMVAAPNAEDVSLGFRTFADISHVTFRDLTDEEITEYLRKGESFDKAGAYAIQGEGAALVDHYDGSLDTIIGLPATRLIKEFPDLVNAEAAEC